MRKQRQRVERLRITIAIEILADTTPGNRMARWSWSKLGLREMAPSTTSPFDVQVVRRAVSNPPAATPHQIVRNTAGE